MSLQSAPVLFSKPISDTAAPRWYALYTYPRHEKVVAEQLRTKALKVFLPTVKNISKWCDRRVEIQAPLFSTYVFAHICAGDRIPALTVRGVIRMLSFNGVPAPIEDEEIESVRLCVERKARLTHHPFLEVGERVRVREGVFQGLEGMVVRSNNGCKLVVTIGIIQQSVALEIDPHLLERVSAPQATGTCRRRAKDDLRTAIQQA